MNTNDFDGNKYQCVISWNFIFERQEKLFKRFMKQEGILNWDDHDFSIDCLSDQEIFKDFLMNRVTEELTEATTDLKHPDHFLEEIADALNFLLESYIIYGWNYDNLDKWEDSEHQELEIEFLWKELINDYVYQVIEKIGLTTNLLKNRKWKNSQYLVDLLLFEKRFKSVWRQFNIMCNLFGITEKMLFKVWTEKYLCNKFRMRSKY